MRSDDTVIYRPLALLAWMYRGASVIIWVVQAVESEKKPPATLMPSGGFIE
nr:MULTISPECIES: hypothetical protein [unclassified Providencia]